MKNLFLLGSPRKNGNSETMAKTVARGLLQVAGNTVEYIHLNNLNIRPCQGCGGCSKTGKCVINDDMQELYIRTNNADRLFFVSPVYFYSVSAQMKSYIDRCQAQWAQKYLVREYTQVSPNRTGYLLSCAATKGKKVFDASTLIIKCLCDALNIQYGTPLLIRNLEQIDALKNKTDEMTLCQNFGMKIAATQH